MNLKHQPWKLLILLLLCISLLFNNINSIWLYVFGTRTVALFVCYKTRFFFTYLFTFHHFFPRTLDGANVFVHCGFTVRCQSIVYSWGSQSYIHITSNQLCKPTSRWTFHHTNQNTFAIRMIIRTFFTLFRHNNINIQVTFCTLGRLGRVKSASICSAYGLLRI